MWVRNFEGKIWASSILTYVIAVPERTDGRTDGQTDRQTTYCGITSLCVASRGKHIKPTELTDIWRWRWLQCWQTSHIFRSLDTLVQASLNPWWNLPIKIAHASTLDRSGLPLSEWQGQCHKKRLKVLYSRYWYTISQLLDVTCHTESHSVTCHPTQVNAPRLNPSHPGWYSIDLPPRDGRLSWPRPPRPLHHRASYDNPALVLNELEVN